MMWKWFRWVLLVIVVIFVAIGITLDIFYLHWMKMNPALEKSADTALAQGFTLTDPENDYVSPGAKNKPGEKPNNLAPYQAPYFDMKSISAGIDDNYLYFKVTFYGPIPQKAPVFDGDKAEAAGVKFMLTDQDGTHDLAGLGANYGWLPVIGLAVPTTSYFNGPTGIEEPEDARFARQDSDSKITGGPGTDYLLAAFPLERLNIKKGDILYVNSGMEVESSKYDHASVDALLGTGKSPALITWDTATGEIQIGSFKGTEPLNNK